MQTATSNTTAANNSWHDRQQRGQTNMTNDLGSNAGLPPEVIDAQTIEESFAAGDIKNAGDHVWALTREYVSDRIPSNNPLHVELVNKIAICITGGMSQRNLVKIRDPRAYILHAVRINFLDLTRDD